MSKKADWTNRILVFFFISSFILSGCQGMSVTMGSRSPSKTSPEYKDGGPPPWAPAHGYRAKYKYRYYPSTRVYYNEGSRVYFYYREGQWKASASLPVGIRLDFNDFVTLEMNTDKPYKYDREVVKRYPPGQLKKMDKKTGKDKWK